MLGGLLLITAVLVTGFEDAPKPVPADRAAYEAASQAAGKDAGAHVRLALWCEAHGMTAERMKHLAAAVAAEPSLALARGLLGLVSFEGKWERPDDVAREAKDDPGRKMLMEEYLRRRAKAADKAEDHWKLALWCDQNDLKAQAIAHYHAVLRLDPRREAAWKRLGFKKVGGRWIKPEWQEVAKREVREQERANKHWKPILERLRSGLFGRDRVRREGAEAELAQVTDPRAVPMVWAIFVPRGAEGQKVAVRVLGQIDAPGSSRALTLLALSSKSPEARGQAVQTLRQRDPRDFAPMLIAMIRDPIKYEVKQVQGPGKPGELVIHDGSTTRKRLYAPPAMPQFATGPSDYVSLDAAGLPVINRLVGRYSGSRELDQWYTPQQASAMLGLSGPSAAQVAGTLERAGVPAAASQKAGAILSANLGTPTAVATTNAQGQVSRVSYIIDDTLRIPIGEMMLEAQMAARAAEAQLAGDAQAVAAYNDAVRGVNRRARDILSGAIGDDLGDDRSAWSKWLIDLFGYAYAAQKSSSDETTVIEQVPLSYVPQTTPFVTANVAGAVLARHACFAAGTRVRALDGPRPIESLRAGDLVLTQDAESGALNFQAIVEVYHNPPNATHRVALDDGSAIVATGIHRLWKAGQGWAMVRELKAGDVLRTLGGVATVQSVEADRTQPVYNLRVAEGESYFVGTSGVLAHDNSTIDPVPEPFDAVGPLPAGSLSTPAGPRRSMLGR